MSQMNPDVITGTISLTVLPQTNGHYVCESSINLTGYSTSDTRCYGQTKEHAIALALEELASHYRHLVQEAQTQNWNAVERNESGEPITKRYHVILHYERIGEAQSKFEAMHNTILGNTVVENAEITVVQIADDLPIDPLTFS